MLRPCWLLFAVCLAVSSCADDITVAEPDAGLGAVATPGSSDTRATLTRGPGAAPRSAGGPGLHGLPEAAIVVGEGGPAVIGPLRLTTMPEADVIVRATRGDGTVVGSLVVAAHTWNHPQYVAVATDGNDIADGDRDLVLTLGTESADPGYRALTAAAVTLRVVDDDRVAMSFYLDRSSVAEGRGCATATIQLGSRPQAEVIVRLASSDPAQLAIASPDLRFGPGTSTSATTVVCPVDDAVIDGQNTVDVAAAIAVASDPAYTPLPPVSYYLTVDDNDFALAVGNLYGLYYTTPGSTVPLAVRLGTAPGHDVVIPVVVSNPAQAVTSVETLTFHAGTWDVPQPVVVTGVDDGAYDWGVPYTVTVGPAVSADAAFDGQSSTTVLYGYY